ncbi:MAG: 30S ribosomal protein S16 [Desulfobulbaceae bacterium A2]|nr:MAG: 30S ribosomal protein S16 [Desulfobulbaceae bacterium A2]
MALRIRLTRMGRKKHPFYRIIVANSDAPRDGKFLEILGTYDPMQQPAAITLDQERLGMWLERGAQPSDTVNSLIKRQAASAAAGV